MGVSSWASQMAVVLFVLVSTATVAAEPADQQVLIPGLDVGALIPWLNRLRVFDPTRAGERSGFDTGPTMASSTAYARKHPHIARYLEVWSKRIERVGTRYYSKVVQGAVDGTVTVTVSIASDGALHSVEIGRSSGHKILDDAVKQIVQQAAPFAPFPLEMRRNYDVLDITRTWSFVHSSDEKASSTPKVSHGDRVKMILN